MKGKEQRTISKTAKNVKGEEEEEYCYKRAERDGGEEEENVGEEIKQDGERTRAWGRERLRIGWKEERDSLGGRDKEEEEDEEEVRFGGRKGRRDSPLPTPLILPLPLITVFPLHSSVPFLCCLFVPHTKTDPVLFPVSAHFCVGFALSLTLLSLPHPSSHFSSRLSLSLSRSLARRSPSLSRRAQANTRRQSPRPVLT